MYNNRKKLFILLIIAALIFSLFTLYISSEAPFSISAKAAALYIPELEKFIYTKNPDEKLGMASTTKIMTALVALEALDENEILLADKESCGIDGSSLYLRPGETISAIDLIYALMLQSANDAACVLANRIAGGIDQFAELMNKKAKELGLKNTHFANPHGLDNKDHYTTAHDLAIISAEAMKNTRFQDIVSTTKREITISENQKIIVNHNKMLKMFDGCNGVKTGYTQKCGRCLVSSANNNNIPVIAVTLSAPDDWNDHAKLLNHAYSLLERRVLCERGSFANEISVIGGKYETVRISAKNDVTSVVRKDSGEITSSIKLFNDVSAPILKGEALGTVIFTSDGREIARVSLIAESEIETNNKIGFLSKFRQRRTFKWNQ